MSDDDTAFKIAERIYEHIVKKVGEYNVFELVINVEYLEGRELRVEAEIDLNPFTGVDPKKLLEEALDSALNVPPKELRKVGGRAKRSLDVDKEDKGL